MLFEVIEFWVEWGGPWWLYRVSVMTIDDVIK